MQFMAHQPVAIDCAVFVFVISLISVPWMTGTSGSVAWAMLALSCVSIQRRP